MAGLRAMLGAVGVETDALPAGAGRRSIRTAWVDQQRGASILEHEGEALRRMARVERQIGAAGLENAEQPDHHVDRALDAQSDHDLGADAARRADDAPAGWRGHRARRS